MYSRETNYLAGSDDDCHQKIKQGPLLYSCDKIHGYLLLVDINYRQQTGPRLTYMVRPPPHFRFAGIFRNGHKCQKQNINRHTEWVAGHFNKANGRFTHLHTDIVGPLPNANGFSYLLTIVGHFSMWPAASPIKRIAHYTAHTHHFVCAVFSDKKTFMKRLKLFQHHRCFFVGLNKQGLSYLLTEFGSDIFIV